MTKQQEKTIERIKKEIPYFDFYSSDKYEIKEFKVDECEYFVSLYIVTGMKDDEGTLAALLCRKYRHAFIGKRGGIQVPYFKRKGSHGTFSASVFKFMNECYHS